MALTPEQIQIYAQLINQLDSNANLDPNTATQADVEANEASVIQAVQKDLNLLQSQASPEFLNALNIPQVTLQPNGKWDQATEQQVVGVIQALSTPQEILTQKLNELEENARNLEPTMEFTDGLAGRSMVDQAGPALTKLQPSVEILG